MIPVSALGEYGPDVENGDALKITVNDAEITAEGAPATAGDKLAEVKAENDRDAGRPAGRGIHAGGR